MYSAEQYQKAAKFFTTVADAVKLENDAIAAHACKVMAERMSQTQTHSDECWRWHHECAVGRVERLETETEAGVQGAAL